MVYTIQHYMTVQAWCTRYNIIWPFRHGVHDTTLYDRSGMVYTIQHYMTVQAWCTRYNIIWPFRHGVHDTTLYDKACQWLATGRWFSPVSSTTKTDRHDITEILLKVTLNTITLFQNTGHDINSSQTSRMNKWITANNYSSECKLI
jgi:hypothetical protein